MHVVKWTLIDRDVALDRGAMRSAFNTAPTVDASVQEAEPIVHEEFNNRVVNVEDHRADEDISNRPEPHPVEVWERA